LGEVLEHCRVPRFAQFLPGDVWEDALDRLFRHMAARHPDSDWADAVREVLGE
jgi:hypothetical protein